MRLTPPGFTSSSAKSISEEGIIAGSATRNSSGNGILWFDFRLDNYRLLPPQVRQPWDIDGDQVVSAGGQIYFISTNTWADLPRGDFSSVSARGVSNGKQVGIGTLPYSPSFRYHAVQWHAGQSGLGAVTDLYPSPPRWSSAHDIDRDIIVGEGDIFIPSENRYRTHALLWNAVTGSQADLHAPPMLESKANGVWGNQVVGMAYIHRSDGWKWRAVLWNLQGGGFVDLQPSGYNASVAEAVRNGWQVGSATKQGESGHAVIWHGSAGSMVDLHQFLPQGMYRSSIAMGVDSRGNVVGFASTFSSVTHAILWRRGRVDGISFVPAERD